MLSLIQVCPTAFISGVWSVGALEVSTGKVSHIEAMNGSTVLLPCTYSSCIGIKNLYFSWHFNDNGTMNKVWFWKEPNRHTDLFLLHTSSSVNVNSHDTPLVAQMTHVI